MAEGGPVKVAIGLASGLGNAVHMLPVVKAFKLMGHHVTLYVQTDFPTAPLWRRCAYADEVLEAPARLDGCRELICGNWRPADWSKSANVTQARLPSIHACEWKSNFVLARSHRWEGPPPDVSDWCRGLDRSRRWDVGIVPGCKGGTWLRKRYPGMAAAAAHFVARGKTIAVFGLADDGVDRIAGEHVDTRDIATLPDALAGCGVVIGTDSGLTLLASSLGVPVVEVYTATSEIKAAPVGKCRAVFLSLPCHPCVSTPRWHACKDWRCREIDPERVVAAAEELIGAGGAER